MLPVGRKMKTQIQPAPSGEVKHKGKFRLSFAALACGLLWLVFAGYASAQTPSAEDHLDRGSVLADKGDLDGAIAEFRQALQLKPDDVDAHYNLGIALHSKGDRTARSRNFVRRCG